MKIPRSHIIRILLYSSDLGGRITGSNISKQLAMVSTAQICRLMRMMLAGADGGEHNCSKSLCAAAVVCRLCSAVLKAPASSDDIVDQ